mgnify:CR=1 FL=1|tara:strand:+ start:451 stop:654 length:204 start_codon:yes stop_codon:yes gene_type:complete
MALDAAEALDLTAQWIAFADQIKAAAQDKDGKTKEDGTKRRFSKSELKELARAVLPLSARTILDVLD